jgi:hypothetical protein
LVPAARDLVLLADARLIGEPDLYAGRIEALVMISSRGRGNFFKILDCPFRLRMMGRAGRKFVIPHGAQFPAQGLLRTPRICIDRDRQAAIE